MDIWRAPSAGPVGRPKLALVMVLVMPLKPGRAGRNSCHVQRSYRKAYNFPASSIDANQFVHGDGLIPIPLICRCPDCWQMEELPIVPMGAWVNEALPVATPEELVEVVNQRVLGLSGSSVLVAMLV